NIYLTDLSFTDIIQVYLNEQTRPGCHPERAHKQRKGTPMLNLDLTLLTQVVNSAKLAAGDDARWLNAIEKGATQMIENPYIEALDDHPLLRAGEGGIYTSNGSCQCRAFQYGGACYHRAMARLYQRYTEAQARQARRVEQAAAQAAIDELFDY